MVFWLIPNKIKLPLFLLFIILALFSWKSGSSNLPWLLIIAGGTMNFVTVVSNKWQMPVRYIKGHTILNSKNAKYMGKEEAKLYWFGDIHKNRFEDGK